MSPDRETSVPSGVSRPVPRPKGRCRFGIMGAQSFR
jgi:hypothetical protein